MPWFDRVPAKQPKTIPCPLALVGESPGDTECCRGEPFVGPSGRLLNKMLALADIDRDDIWLGNVFDFKLPENQLKNICTKEKNDVPVPGCGFLSPEYHHHLGRLRADLHAVSPTVIVPLGGTALWAFQGHADLTRSRGAVTTAARILPGAKLLPTLHPDYVLHSYGMLTTVVADFRKAMAEAQGAYVETSRELWIEPTLADLFDFGERIRRADLLSVDIETALGQVTCIGFAIDRHCAICVPFVDFRVPSRSYWRDPEIELAAWQWVRDVLALPVPKLFQKGSFDVWHLTRLGLRVCNWTEDTLVQQHARSPEEPKSLAFMASRWAKIGDWKRMNAREEDKRDA